MNLGRRLPIVTLCALAILLTLTACGSVPDRRPVTEGKETLPTISGLPENARFWGDEVPEELLQSLNQVTPAQAREGLSSWLENEINFIGISGGGQDGAFGAGVINGWTASGTRPEFQIVTGISTGALSAPFIFLGSDYDDELAAVYTLYGTSDLLDERGWLEAATSDALYDTTKLRNVIKSFVDDTMVRRMAEQHERGRRLFIGTTHMDAGRPVIWSLTEIARSDYPRKKELIVSILLASSAVPGAFPPVLINVEINGEQYDELHADGGTVSQVFIYRPGINFGDLLKKLGIKKSHNVYVIRNSKLRAAWNPLEPSVFRMVGSALSTLIRSQGSGDVTQIYWLTKRDGATFNLTYIPEDFELQPDEPFDRRYMTALYKLGYEMARTGNPWESAPPTIRPHEIYRP
jgi:hypothetical protein